MFFRGGATRVATAIDTGATMNVSLLRFHLLDLETMPYEWKFELACQAGAYHKSEK